MNRMSTKELLQLQVRVVVSLVLRETRSTFGSSHIGYLWAIITPSIGTAVLVLLFSLIGRSAPFGSSLMLFFATGLLTLDFFNKLSKSLMGALNANKALLTYPLIKENDTFFARVILVSATYLLIMLIFYGTLIILDFADPPHSPFVLLEAFFAIILLGFGFGTLNAIISSLWSSWSFIETILTRPLLIISGIFYVPSALPPEAVALIKWNPVVHLVEWVRIGYYSNYDSAVFSSTYVLLVAMFLILFALLGERVFRNKRV